MFLEVNRIKKKFRSATLLLLYQIKLNITRQNGYAKQNIILLHFLGNKPRRFLSLRSFYFYACTDWDQSGNYRQLLVFSAILIT